MMVRQLISTFLFSNPARVVPRLVLHGLQRAQQGSWCRIPGFPWTDWRRDWESQQGGQDLLMGPELPHWSTPHQPLLSAAPKPSWREREQGENKEPCCFGVGLFSCRKDKWDCPSPKQMKSQCTEGAGRSPTGQTHIRVVKHSIF